MKILMVTPYPPLRDGIAAYAVQSVARLRADGHDVEVLSPGPSAAHHHLDLTGPRGALALARRVRRYDKVIVQFHPDVFFPVPATAWQWRVESLALFVAFACARHLEVRLHEIDYSRGRGGRVVRLVNRLPWRAVTEIVVHTELERTEFADAFGVPRSRITVMAHGVDFRPCTDLSQPQARATLGLPAADVMFLNIGFIQPHKGFDRCVRALAQLNADGFDTGYRLDIVGSVRTPDPAYVGYLRGLSALVEATPGAFLHEGYVSAELFDRWLVACDVVVLPYRSIWSSGVMERALLYDRQVIATDVGGLSFQSADRDRVTLVHDDIELVRAMRDVVLARTGVLTGARGPDLPSRRASWEGTTTADRETVQEDIRRLAAMRRGTGPRADGSPAAVTAPSLPVRNVVPLVLPEPASALPGVRAVKRLLRRLLAWEIEPLVNQVNALRGATIKALDTEGLESAGGPAANWPQPPRSPT